MRQLIANGVSPVMFAREAPKKLVEVQAYMTSRQREVRAEAELHAATGNVREENKLTAELQTIQDSYRRMPNAKTKLISVPNLVSVWQGRRNFHFFAEKTPSHPA